MTNEKDDVIITDVSNAAALAKLSTLVSIGVALGGEQFVTGLNRVMDGQCPDCGEPIETHPQGLRCFKLEDKR